MVDMNHLNPQQRQAVLHRNGPLLILAGAGTGKTRVVTERMAHLIRQGVKPANILGVTFTNKAAGEMRIRLAGLVGRRTNLRDLIIATFHSLAVRIIRRDARLLGYSPGFSICDQGEQTAILRKAAATVRAGATLNLDDARSRISSLKNKGLSPEEFARSAIDDDENVLAAVYRRYQESLRRQNSLDFDDLLLQAHALLREHPEALEHWRARFQQVLVDEFQDTNPVQFSLVRLLAAPLDNLCVVGDDDQSIYAWRGAMAGNILKFHESYPGATTVTLEQNYRSTSTILSAANALIKNNSGRREKNLWSDLGRGRNIRLVAHNDQFEEADGIASAIRQRLADEPGRAKPGDFAVIIRANHQSRQVEDALMASRLPYEVIGGQSLFDRKEARDVLSFLAVVANPEADSQLLRIVNVPPRGIGEKTVDILSAHAARSNVRLSRLLAEPELAGLDAGKAAEACRHFAAQIEGWRRRLRENGFAGLVDAILEEGKYAEELRHLYRDPLESAARWNQAVEVGESLAGFAARNPGADPLDVLADFLCEALLAGRGDSGDRKGAGDAVRIITAHSAKGLEFPFVFIPGMEEEVFPHRNAVAEGGVEEERRLFYVAMTRARRELTLSWSRHRVLRGKEQKRERSRFIDEVPVEYMDVDDRPTREEEALDWISGLRARLDSKGKASGE
jgi:superfamily I DNA/RNA helicase